MRNRSDVATHGTRTKTIKKRTKFKIYEDGVVLVLQMERN